jgi:hypothetical protein
VPTFAGIRVSRGQRNGSRTAVNLGFLDRSPHFSFKYFFNYPDEDKWAPFQTQYFSEKMVTSGTEPGTSEAVSRNHRGGLRNIIFFLIKIFPRVIQIKLRLKHGVVKNVVFWDVRPCGSCKNRRFGGT